MPRFLPGWVRPPWCANAHIHPILTRTCRFGISAATRTNPSIRNAPGGCLIPPIWSKCCRWYTYQGLPKPYTYDATDPVVQLQRLQAADASYPQLWDLYGEVKKAKRLDSLPLECHRQLLQCVVPNAANLDSVFSLANQGVVGRDEADCLLQEAPVLLARLGELSQDLLQRHQHTSTALTEHDCELVVGGYLQFGQLEPAFRWLEDVVPAGIALTQQVFHYLFFALMARGLVDQALAIKAELQPNQSLLPATYNVLLHGLIYTPAPEPTLGERDGVPVDLDPENAVNRAQQIEALLNEMADQGQPLGQRVYNDIFSGLVDRHPVAEPDVVYCNLQDNPTVAKDDIDTEYDEAATAVELYRTIRWRLDFQADTTTFQLIIRAYALMSDFQHVWKTFTQYIQAQGYGDINPGIVTLVIDEAVVNGESDTLTELFSMVKAQRIAVLGDCTALYHHFFKAYAYDQIKPQRALGHWSHMLNMAESSSTPAAPPAATRSLPQWQAFHRPLLTSAIVSTMIEHCALVNNSALLQQVLRQVAHIPMALDPDNYNALVLAYCQLNQVIRAVETLQITMPALGFVPDFLTVRRVYHLLDDKKLSCTKSEFVRWIQQHYPDWADALDQQKMAPGVNDDPESFFRDRPDLLRELGLQEYRTPEAPPDMESLEPSGSSVDPKSLAP
ncbi:hypothetical protein H4R34_002960 [Dimargaris verticillata]|uniref:Pentatricopeptide repeat domain-containing protein n=1 Tax=Dimargaris verticillata TaxID=2761393 RepID=A0A9W8B306_9FUNG|nr:hypothetical protein H4R34_002960 [Dimargaris verticillata]